MTLPRYSTCVALMPVRTGLRPTLYSYLWPLIRFVSESVYVKPMLLVAIVLQLVPGKAVLWIMINGPFCDNVTLAGWVAGVALSAKRSRPTSNAPIG